MVAGVYLSLLPSNVSFYYHFTKSNKKTKGDKRKFVPFFHALLKLIS